MKYGVMLLVAVSAACSSGEERARQAVEFRQAQDSLLGADVVTSLQPASAIGRLIYDRPVDLSYDSLRVKRPDLVPARRPVK